MQGWLFFQIGEFKVLMLASVPVVLDAETMLKSLKPASWWQNLEAHVPGDGAAQALSRTNHSLR